MKTKMAFVIKDKEGNFTDDYAFYFIENMWHYVSYTGIYSGFTWYRYKEAAIKALKKINNLMDKHGLNRKFNIDYIDVSLLKKGKRIVNEIEVAA